MFFSFIELFIYLKCSPYNLSNKIISSHMTEPGTNNYIGRGVGRICSRGWVVLNGNFKKCSSCIDLSHTILHTVIHL